MELPVAPQSYRPSPDALVRGIKRARAIFARTIASEDMLDGALAFADPNRPGVDLANAASELLLPAGLAPDAFVAALLAHYREKGVAPAWLDSAEAIWPAPLAAALEAAGFRPVGWQVFQLDVYRPPAKRNDRLQIIPARAAYAQLLDFFELLAHAEHHPADDAHAHAIAQALLDRLDEQRFDAFLVRLDGRPVGFAGVLALGQMGVIDPAFTDPNCRGQSIGGTLMHYLVEHCARALFEQVVLERHDGCPSIPFYQGLGFKPVARFVRYHAPRPAGGADNH